MSNANVTLVFMALSFAFLVWFECVRGFDEGN